ncbi:Hypothetical predicted protein [Pelobates cultripes]|uniref:L1 transposable element RRM domain-containing protein n=1 Tax=Pelobates cultripes TaxID=61616 RepID=A0AAD1RV91_PELCU|nr:Hypothetical predicted protein [Pelobates cultripes]
MGGGKKARNSSVAPIFRQKPEQQRAPSLEPLPSDSDSEMSSQAPSERTEAPLTRRDMQGFLADFKQSVAEELDKRICPILEGMADLSARAQAAEAKMADTEEIVQAHGSEILHLRDQLRSLEDTNEDLNNRTRRNNIRVRGVPESVSPDLLTDTLTEAFQHLLPEATTADLLMDRAHRALRAPSTNAAVPRDIVVRLHFYHIKERIMRAARDTPIELNLPQIPETPHSNAESSARQPPSNNPPARTGDRPHRNTALQNPGATPCLVSPAPLCPAGPTNSQRQAQTYYTVASLHRRRSIRIRGNQHHLDHSDSTERP